VLVGKITLVGLEGVEIGAEESALLERVQPAGVILFARNIDSPEQVRRLCDRLRAILRPEPILGIDQEGGTVERLRRILGPLPPALAVAASGSATRARSLGAVCGAALRLLGLNLDLAPVVDLGWSGADNALGTRVFGRCPRRVAALARSFLRGLRRQGIEGCLKHFPGLGRARVDTHHELSLIDRSAKELERDLWPFRRLLREAPSVMIAHAAYPALAASDVPATRSAPIATALLREQIGYSGCAFSDDLRMGGLLLPPAEGAIECLRAGCDALLLCGPIGEHIGELEAIDRQVRKGWRGPSPPAPLPQGEGREIDLERRFAEAARRVEALRSALGREPAADWSDASWARCKRRALALSRKVAAASLRREGEAVAIDPAAAPLVLLPEAELIVEQLPRLRRRFAEALATYPIRLDSTEAEWLAAQNGSRSVVLATIDADRHPGQQQLATRLAQTRRLAGQLQLGFPEESTRGLAPSTVFAWHSERHFVEYGLRALFGRFECRGADPLAV